MQRGGSAAILVLLLATLVLPAQPAQPVRQDDFHRQGQTAELRGDWLEACKAYAEAMRQDRNRIDLKEAYQRSLRHFYLQQRHRDPGFRDVLTKLAPNQSLDIYKQVLLIVSAYYVDRQKTDLNVLFQNGLQELRFALDDEVFRKEYMGSVSPDVLERFKDRLESWADRKITGLEDAREQVLAVARAGQHVGINTQPAFLTLVSLEFASGACNALDEYTLFLTPSHQIDVKVAQRSKLVGVGIELAVIDQKVEIARIYPRSPAEEAGLMVHDRVLAIDGDKVDNQPPESIAERLRGESGTLLRLTVLQAGQMETRNVPMQRRYVMVPSVEFELIDKPMEELLGYIRILNFQDNTLQEVKEAIARLQTAGMKGLILDLRGNPGGLFKSAVQISKLFLADGIVVHGQSPVGEFNGPLPKPDLDSTSRANPLLLPMVVLIDAETASSAEVLAGALKEHNRARLVGSTTYGKGSIQCVIPLKKSTGGIRITVAHFSSPTHQPYNGRGIVPHDFVMTEGNVPITTASAYLQGLLRMMMR
jgi:carboxyl-terminal processing protease